MRTTLASQPASQQRKGDYEKVIRTFHEVYRLSPAYTNTPAALAAVAGLYRQMGRLFAKDRYYLEAIKAYQFLISQYPQNRLAGQALFAVGEIYRIDLQNPQQARQTYQQYLAEHPGADKAPEAREIVNQIDRSLAEETARRAAPLPRSAADRRAEGPPEVTAIRRWVGPNYSRIVIAVDGEVKFNTSRLSNPERIVLDLENTRLNPALLDKTFSVEDGFLRQVRVAQFAPAVTRVVLDVEKIEDYSVFPLPNPFRLVIDIHGIPALVGAKSKAPVSARSTPERGRSAGSAASAPANRPAPTTQLSSRGELSANPEAAPPGTKTKKGSGLAELNAPPERAPAETTLPPPSPAVASRPPAGEPGKGASREAVSAAKAAAPTVSGSRTLTRALGLKIGRIVIDPGHGGHDTGTIGPTGLSEKDLVLDVGLRLQQLLESKAGYEVVLTRSDDTFIPLEERTAIANQKAADLFLSIHANASRSRSARGIETYYLNFTSDRDALELAARENATSQESVHQLQDLIKKIALTEKIEESQDFARRIQQEVCRWVGKGRGQALDRGVKKAPFVVLIGANMPSILTEISFLTNPRDERLLKRPDYRQKIAEALYGGVIAYVKTLGGVRPIERAASVEETSAATRPKF